MDEINWTALARIFDGAPTPDDRQWFAAWVSADPTRLTYTEQLRDAWTTAGAIPSRLEIHCAWEAVAQAIDAGQTDPDRAGKPAAQPSVVAPQRRTPGSLAWLRTRSAHWSVLGMTAIIAGVLLFRTPSVPGGALGGSTSERVSSTTYATPPGKRASIQLRDGTTVTLNAASTLEVSHEFGANNRTVALNGQAVFDVQHATTTPFIVNTGATQTTVLGTVFSVRSYDTDVQVAVRSGKVAVTSCTASPQSQPCEAPGRIVLQANDIASVTSAGRVTVARRTDQELNRAFAWTAGHLVFQDTPIREALDELERWYDVKFVVSDPSLIRGHLTTTFNKSQLTEHDLRDLSALLQASVKQYGNTITIRPIEAGR